MTTIPASHHDLLDGKFATIATIDPDGRPQLSEVGFLADDDAVRVSLNGQRQKTRNLQARSAVNLFILDLTNTMRYRELRGGADLAPDADYAFADRIGAKYGADLRQIDQPGDKRYIVTIRPHRINAVDLSRG